MYWRGWPWLSLAPALKKEKLQPKIQLSDLYPNKEGCSYTINNSKAEITYLNESIDALNVPKEHEGLRTIFNGFHHFREKDAVAILSDAVQNKVPIAIFDGDPNRLVGCLLVVFFFLPLFLMMPFVRPFSWSRLFFTYIIPFVPLVVLFDGIVSMLRVYSPEELHELVKKTDDSSTYDWQIGVKPIPKSPLGISYLVGIPKK